MSDKAKTKTVLGGGGDTTPSTSPFALRKKAEHVLSEESAQEQVLEFLEYYDIDVEKIPKDENGSNSIERALKQLVEYIRRGSVEMGRDGDQKMKVTVMLSKGDTVIEFGELGAKHKLAMDRASKTGGNYERIYALMASLAGLPTGAIEKLPARDLAMVEILGMVFLAA